MRRPTWSTSRSYRRASSVTPRLALRSTRFSLFQSCSVCARYIVTSSRRNAHVLAPFGGACSHVCIDVPFGKNGFDPAGSATICDDIRHSHTDHRDRASCSESCTDTLLMAPPSACSTCEMASAGTTQTAAAQYSQARRLQHFYNTIFAPQNELHWMASIHVVHDTHHNNVWGFPSQCLRFNRQHQ